MRLGITPSWFSLSLFDVLGRTKILPFLEQEGGTEKPHPLLSPCAQACSSLEKD